MHSPLMYDVIWDIYSDWIEVINPNEEFRVPLTSSSLSASLKPKLQRDFVGEIRLNMTPFAEPFLGVGKRKVSTQTSTLVIKVHAYTSYRTCITKKRWDNLISIPVFSTVK